MSCIDAAFWHWGSMWSFGMQWCYILTCYHFNSHRLYVISSHDLMLTSNHLNPFRKYVIFFQELMNCNHLNSFRLYVICCHELMMHSDYNHLNSFSYKKIWRQLFQLKLQYVICDLISHIKPVFWLLTILIHLPSMWSFFMHCCYLLTCNHFISLRMYVILCHASMLYSDF